MNLIPILQKHFKEGDRLYSMIHGWVTLYGIDSDKDITYPISMRTSNEEVVIFTHEGKYFEDEGECILFPDSGKDWSKFIEIKEGDAVVYLKDGIWHLGRAEETSSGEMGVKQPNGSTYSPEKIVPADLFDFNNFENMKL